MTAAALRRLAARVLAAAESRGLLIATAESCTGGMIAAALTDIAGASAAVERGFVTYSNQSKTDLLGVPPELIASAGAVSAGVARAMAEGALKRSQAAVAVAVTGVAGPGGGSEDKPVGLVWFGLAQTGRASRVERRVFAQGGRDFVRLRAAETALGLLLAAIES